MANATSWTGWVFIAERGLKALVFRFEIFRRQTRPGVGYVAPVLSGPNEPRRSSEHLTCLFPLVGTAAYPSSHYYTVRGQVNPHRSSRL